ncbi:hypothetical protein [Stenotrophomonas sp. RG-453]|uniref:hypothetical protein n=1 Tax=Stenotrophomonas sp. RG-453 TaxID=2957502 RepID=UPI0029C9DF33|nr:hypothetical protein [Stenotrophomonas sp. RG-453]MDX5517963.1 hypothetical protein [Stenotrophomonas sp. RG-453]
MADFQEKFMNSLAGGFQFGQQIKAQRDTNQLNQLASLAYQAPQEQRQEILGQAAAVDAGSAGALDKQLGNSDDRRNKTMINMAKLLTSVPEQARPGLYQQFIPTLSKFGLSDLPTEYNAQTAPVIDQAAQSLVQAYSGGGAGSGVQSTYVDGNGQRVAIMRDGSTQILGDNDPGATGQTLTIDVNGTPTQVTFDKRTQRYTTAALDAPNLQQAPQQPPQGGYQQINGQQTYIDPSLPPQVQQQIRQSLASGQEPPAQMAFGDQPGTPLTGRRAEDEAAAVERARINAQNQNFETDIEQKRRLAEQQAQIDAQKAREMDREKADSQRLSGRPAAEASLRDAESNLDRLAAQARQLSSHRGLASITGIRGSIPDVLGSDAANARAELESLKSQVGFGVLQAMREASKTGGALGSVSDTENQLLQSNLAALMNSQSVESFKANLKKIEDYAGAAKGRMRQAFNSQYQERQTPQVREGRRPQPPSVGEVRNGYRYLGGEPGDRNSWEKL